MSWGALSLGKLQDSSSSANSVSQALRASQPHWQDPLLIFLLNRDPAAIVTFLIGPGDSPKQFILHKERVFFYSPVLNAAFNGNFVEVQSQTYRLEDISPGAFRLYTRWIYQQKLDLRQLRDQYEDEEVCSCLRSNSDRMTLTVVRDSIFLLVPHFPFGFGIQSLKTCREMPGSRFSYLSNLLRAAGTFRFNHIAKLST